MEILKEYGQLTTLHGIPNIFRAKSLFLKIIWILMFLSSISFLFYMVINSIISYLKFEVVTKITIINEQPSDFPTITICNRNTFNTLKDKKIFDEYYEKIKDLDFDFKYHFFSLVAYNLSQSKKDIIGLKLTELITDCKINGIKCDFANDFVEIYNFLSGTCYRYNSGKNSSGHKIELKKLYDISRFNGLKLKIFTGHPELSFPSESTGLYIYIHNSTIEPLLLGGFDVSTGLETNIAVNRLFINKKENPYSECYLDIYNRLPDFLKQVYSDDYQYTRENCFYLCYQILLITKIGCHHPAFNRLNSTRPCLTLDEANKSYSFFYQNYSINYLDNYCKKICPQECNSIHYNSFISHGNFPNSYYLNMSRSNITSIKKYKNSYLSLNIYYNSFSYTQIDELAHTELIDLVANIGGTLGLFLGVSLLSIAEIFELIYLLLEAFIKKRDAFRMKIRSKS